MKPLAGNTGKSRLKAFESKVLSELLQFPTIYGAQSVQTFLIGVIYRNRMNILSFSIRNQHSDQTKPDATAGKTKFQKPANLKCKVLDAFLHVCPDSKDMASVKQAQIQD